MADTATVEEPPLYPPQRQAAILELARQHGRVEVASLAETFEVTTETIRRDLSDLQRRRLVRRVHGGAILADDDGFEPLLARRETRHADEKRRIAQAAVDYLPAEGTVLVDSGSTMARLAQQVPADLPLTIVTNSVLNAQLLADNTGAEVVMLGGTLDKKTLAMVDEQTVATVRDLRVDTAFIGTDGMTAEGGLTTPYRSQAELKRAMIGAARQVICLADSSKLGQVHFARFAGCRDLDLLITDTGMDVPAADRFEAMGLEVVRV